MELKEILKNRRSYRHDFSDYKVTKEELKYLVEAAFLAPTGCNLQSSRIIGILDEEKLKEIGEIFGRSWAKTATAAVIIATKPVALKGRGDSRYREDFGAAAQNLLLAVEDLGLATTWIQGNIEFEKAKEIGKLLNVPEDYTVTGYFPIGQPIKKVDGPKKISFNERCFLDEFGKEF